MDVPWKSHIDSMAKTLVKSKKRVKSKPIVNELIVETYDSKEKLKNSSASNKSLAKTGLKPMKSGFTETKKISTQEKEIKVTEVEKHTKPKSDSIIDSIRKEKEIEKKQKIQQLMRLKEIQEEEDVQKKQMKKLQAEMKSKPFV